MNIEVDGPGKTQEISLRRILSNLRIPPSGGEPELIATKLTEGELKVAVQQMIKTIRNRGSLSESSAKDLLLLLNMSLNGSLGVKGVRFDAASQIFLSPSVVNGSLLTLQDIEKRYR